MIDASIVIESCQNGSLKINIPLVVKYIDDAKMAIKPPKYFTDLHGGVFAYFIACPSGESIFGYSFGENDNTFFVWQMLISGFNTDLKVRNCAWQTEWSEWRTL